MPLWRGALNEGALLVDAKVPENVRGAADPADFHAIYMFPIAQAEVEPRSIVTLITPATVHFVDQRQLAGADFNPRARAVAEVAVEGIGRRGLHTRA